MAGSRIKGITIEIDGNTSKLQKALSSVDKSLKDTQTTLRDVDKLLKLDPKNTELLSQKQKALGDAVNLTKQRLEKLKEAQSQVARGSSEWDSLQREIIETEQNIKNLEKQQREFGSVASQVIAEAGRKVQEFGGKVEAAGQKLAPLSAAAGGFAAGMIWLGYSSINAADYHNTLSKHTGLRTDSHQKIK
ncbi:MAG: phage tail tape measure protein [Ruminococcus sp.]|nr:phage tail tape measure protein [Ruminococcus sp.]